MSGASSAQGQPRARPWTDDESWAPVRHLGSKPGPAGVHARPGQRGARDRQIHLGHFDAALAVASGTGRPMTGDCDLCRRPDRLYLDSEDETTMRCIRCSHGRWRRDRGDR